MAKFVQVCSLVVLSAAVLVSGSSWQPWHGHGSASSYAQLVKHDAAPKSHGWAAGDNSQWQDSNNHWSSGDHSHHHEPHSYPKYEFDYGVKDTKTGDIKNQWETRDGDKVKGGYTMKEADGTTRVVEYTADDHSGFNAVVKHIGHAAHPAPVYHHNSGWEAAQAHNSHHDHHGHASSYVNVNQVNHESKW